MAVKITESLSSLFSLIFGTLTNFIMSIVKGFSSLVWGVEPAPLDETQIKLIRSSWGKVENSNLQVVGLMMFRRLFEIAPYLKDLFPFGYNPDSKDLKVHALGVMNTVAVAVKELDNPSVLRSALLELGAVHKQFDLTDREFQNVGAALLWTLEQGLGDEFTPQVKSAWIAAYGYIQETMKEGFK